MIKKEILKPILRYLDFLLNTTLYSRLISQDSKIFDRNDYSISNLDLIFIHVMKTGGTSFVQILKEVEKKGVRIKYFGHYGISIAETSPKPIYCTILRNPVDRSISLYNHFLRDKKSAYHNLALKGFSTFMRNCKEAQNSFCKKYSGEMDKDINEDIYNLALNNLKNFKHVLFFENLDKDFEKIKDIYNLEKNKKYHLNSSIIKDYNDDIKRNISLFYNYYDMKLYNNFKILSEGSN